MFPALPCPTIYSQANFGWPLSLSSFLLLPPMAGEVTSQIFGWAEEVRSRFLASDPNLGFSRTQWTRDGGSQGLQVDTGRHLGL